MASYSPPSSRVSLAEISASKLALAQCLFSLAVAEARCREAVLGLTGSGGSVRLKRPSDIYAVDGGSKKKVGGVLANTSFGKGMADLAAGEIFPFSSWHFLLFTQPFFSYRKGTG